MKTRVVKDKNFYYVQFLDTPKDKNMLGEAFITKVWKFYGHLDEENVFNRAMFGCLDDAAYKAKQLAGHDSYEIVWESA